MTPCSSHKGLNIVVLVSGRGTNLQAILDAQNVGLIQSRVTLVISNKEAAPALERAKACSVPTKVITSKNRDPRGFFLELQDTVRAAKPDLIVLAGFMKILPPDFVKTFRNRIINIHPALLPNFPGLDAQAQAIAAGAKKTGCTVHVVNEGCDTGPIILQKTLNVLPNETRDHLAERLLPLEHQALIEAIQKIETGKIKL